MNGCQEQGREWFWPEMGKQKKWLESDEGKEGGREEGVQAPNFYKHSASMTELYKFAFAAAIRNVIVIFLNKIMEKKQSTVFCI